MKLWIRNNIMNICGKLDLRTEYNAKIKNSLLEGTIRLKENILIKNCIIKGNPAIIASSLENCTVVGDVSIEKYCAIADDVLFQGLNHNMNYPAIQMQFYRKITGKNLIS